MKPLKVARESQWSIKLLGSLCCVWLFSGVTVLMQTTASADDNLQTVAVVAEHQQNQFASLLTEAGLSFSMPAGFHEIAIEDDYVLPYEKRLMSDDEGLEVRYAIRPLKRIEIDYEDPHNSAPHPNDLFEMLFRTISETLAGQTYVRSHIYPADQAREKYHAGWASAAVFDVSPDVSKKYHQGLLLAIHHNDKADAYLLFLTNDLQQQKEAIKAAEKSLVFTRFDKGINRPTL